MCNPWTASPPHIWASVNICQRRDFSEYSDFPQSLPTFALGSLSCFEYCFLPSNAHWYQNQNILYIVGRVKRLKRATLINIVDFGESSDKSYSPTLPIKYEAVKNWDFDLLLNWKKNINILYQSIKNVAESKWRYWVPFFKFENKLLQFSNISKLKSKLFYDFYMSNMLKFEQNIVREFSNIFDYFPIF